MGKPKIHRASTFESYPIYLDKQGSRKEILSAILNILHYMWTACHRRLFICHFSIHIPDGFNLQANDLLSSSLQSWRRTMQNRKIKAEYIWVRELGTASYNDHPHFHIFVVIQGKYIQSAVNVAKHLSSLLDKRLGGETKRLYCHPPQKDAFKWGKKVSAKLDNLADAIQWISYAAKASTKDAPFGQKTFGFSKGFLQKETVLPLTDEEERQEEALFYSADLSMTNEDWADWGGGIDWEEVLDFDPLTGGSKKAVKAASAALSSTPGDNASVSPEVIDYQALLGFDSADENPGIPQAGPPAARP